VTKFNKAFRYLLFACFFVCWQSEQRAESCDAVALIQKANTLNLARSRAWQVLLHYKPSTGGWRSLVKDPQFFLTPQGFSDPEGELNASIQALTHQSLGKKGIPFAERFPARAQWLIRELNMGCNQSFQAQSENVSAWMRRINPHKAALVFPSAAFKGLGAMFGHTLIRFDSTNENPLLSYSVSYSALSTKDNICSFVWKGLTGGFAGYYNLLPYYRKVHEYQDMEERDIWSYGINFTPDEVEMMALHALELRNIKTPYYFLDENCALNLLFIIEAGRPSLKLVDRYWAQAKFWVVPSDTVIFLWNEGVIASPHFEPSLARQLDYYSRMLPAPLVSGAVEMAHCTNAAQILNRMKFAPFSPHEAETCCALAAKITQFDFSQLKTRQEVFQDVYKTLTTDRTNRLNANIPPPTPPSEGHPASRVELGFGSLKNDEFLQFGFRPAYHDIFDPPGAYSGYSTFNLFNTLVRYYPEKSQVKIDQLDIVQAGSLTPGNLITKRFAWSFGTGLRQQFLADLNKHLLYYVSGGFGRSYRIGEGMYYGLAKLDFVSGSGLDGSLDIAPGFEVGINYPITAKCEVGLQGIVGYYGLSQNGFLDSVNFCLKRTLSTKDSVVCKFGLLGEGNFRGIPEFSVGWQHYF
jgi:hypothetical protein